MLRFFYTVYCCCLFWLILDQQVNVCVRALVYLCVCVLKFKQKKDPCDSINLILSKFHGFGCKTIKTNHHFKRICETKWAITTQITTKSTHKLQFYPPPITKMSPKCLMCVWIKLYIKYLSKTMQTVWNMVVDLV